jgi:heavy metal translocating P-type ATPase
LWRRVASTVRAGFVVACRFVASLPCDGRRHRFADYSVVGVVREPPGGPVVNHLPRHRQDPWDGGPRGDPVRAVRSAILGDEASAILLVWWAVLATVLLAVAGLADRAQISGPLTGLCYLACYVAGGWLPARAGWRAARGRVLTVDQLMVVAAVGAAAIGQVFDGALLMVIFATTGALEAVATERTADGVRRLLRLAPDRATRILPGGGQESVDTAALRIGDVVLVHPGERVGADGAVLDGYSEVDQASITGEPLPVAKEPGDEVFAGTLNGGGALRVQVHRPAEESVVARIVAMVEQASTTKANTQVFIERVEQRYSVAVVMAALSLLCIPVALGAALEPALLRALTFMIVASPCAVVLATMPPLLSSIANASRHGVLVKSAVVMEQLGTTTLVAFDKTGTLTEGTPRVTDVLPVDETRLGGRELLAMAAAAEGSSDHPLARAIVAAAREARVTVPPAGDSHSRPGRGVSALVGGCRVAIGSPAMLTDRGDARIEQSINGVEELGRTAVVVLIDGRPVGVLGLADRLRPDTRRIIETLRRLTGGEPVLLTGDNAGAATWVGQESGIAEVHSGLLPADKVEMLCAIQESGQRVAFVGDGVNDAPALATADVGIAMSHGGSDLALHSSDVVIVRNELATLPAMIDLSRRAHTVVVQNLILAGVAILTLVALDLSGHLPLPLAVAGHEGSTILVAANGFRLLGTPWCDTQVKADLANSGRAELAGYVLAALILVAGGAFVLGPILNWVSGPVIVVVCVWLTTSLNDRRRSRGGAQ